MVVTDRDLYCKTHNVLEQWNAACDHSRLTPARPFRSLSSAGIVLTVGNSRLNTLSRLPIVGNACTAAGCQQMS